MVRSIAAVVAALATVISANATPVTFELSLPSEGTNMFGIELVLNENEATTDSAMTNAAGSFDAELDLQFGDQDVNVNSFELTGGALTFDDFGFDFGGVLFVDGSGVGGAPTTVVVPSVVTSGSFDAADHELTINQGTFVVSGLFSDNFSLAELPFNGPGMGTGSVSVVEVGNAGNQVTYEASMSLPIAFTDRVLDFAMGDPVDMDVTVVGNLVGSGQFVVGSSSGDFNGNGSSDAADFTVWGDTLGSTLDLRADGNGDLVVSELDLTVWRDDFDVIVSTTSTVVPEMATLWLAAIAWFAIAVSGRRQC